MPDGRHRRGHELRCARRILPQQAKLFRIRHCEARSDATTQTISADAARIAPLKPAMTASAVAEGQRRCAGRQVGVDVAVDQTGALLAEARPEREAEIRGGTEFDTDMGAVAGDRAGVGIIERTAQSRAE